MLTSREKKQILRKLNTIRFNEKIKRDDRFKLANDLLRDYANAKLVITSRIHTTLPCMAFGNACNILLTKVMEKMIDLENY